MGSVGSPLKSRTPFDAYKDCAQGICNIYCSQWCSYPPPLDSGDDSGTSFSPLIIAVIGILASAFLLVCYYAIITKYCSRRRGNSRWRRNHNNVEAELQLNHDQLQVNSNGGLDDGLIKSITVFQFKKGVGLVEGTECSVCLNEFKENENLRLLPKCCHAFHPHCIDIWLKSHSNCPLCRANAAPISTPTPPNAATQSSSVLNISAMESHRPNDLVFVIDHHQEEFVENQEVCVNGVSDFLAKNLQQDPAIRNKKILDEDGSREMRRSRFSTRGGLMVADVLEMNEDEEIKVEIQQQLEIKIMGSSKRVEDEESK